MKTLTIPTKFTAVDKFSGPVNKMTRSAEASMARFERKINKIGDSFLDVSKKSAMVGVAITAPLILVTKAAVDFEDKLADIGKTTGLGGDKLKAFGDELLEISKTTRTSIEDLSKIGEVGGQLGIAEKDLISFTKAADMFNIALGSDFSGGTEEAIQSIGKIKSLFAETRDLDISTSILKTGSAINELGAIGSGTSQNITDFTLRLGALPDALKPSIENVIALGTFLEEVGINAEIGSGGLTKVLLVAGKNLDGFASQMNLTKAEASKLLSEDPTDFVKRFATSLKDASPEELATKMNKLGINSQEAIKVIGALGTGTERLTELQDAANIAFEKGTSLQNEAATKNETSAAKLAMMKNNLEALSIKMGNALIPILIKLLETVTPVIESFASWMKNNPTLVSSIAKLAVKAALVAFSISGITLVLGVMTKAMKVAKFAVAGYNVVLGIMSAFSTTAAISVGKSNVAVKAYTVTTKIITAATKVWGLVLKSALGPIGWAIIAIGALSAGVYALSKAFSSQSQSQRLNNEVQSRALENSIDQRVEVMLLFKALRKAEEGSDAYNKTLEKLEELQPGIIDKYNLQVKSLQAINAAEKELIGNIMKRATEEARAELMREKYKEALTLESDGPGFWQKYYEGTILGKLTGYSAEEANQANADALKSDADVLAEQQYQSQNPISTPSIQSSGFGGGVGKTNKEEVTIDFKNMPLGVEVTRSGVGNGVLKMPSPATTRQ